MRSGRIDFRGGDRRRFCLAKLFQFFQESENTLAARSRLLVVFIETYVDATFFSTSYLVLQSW